MMRINRKSDPYAYSTCHRLDLVADLLASAYGTNQ